MTRTTRLKRGRPPRRSGRTKGGRGSDRAKVAWLHTLECIVAVRQKDPRWPNLLHGYRSAAQLIWSPCNPRLEVHHDRPGGARATDRRTAPVCMAHHREGPHSLAELGRHGFQEFHGIDMDAETTWYEAEWQRYKQQGAFQ